jgi:type I restriction enzyme S subunit
MVCDKVYRLRSDERVALPAFLEIALNAPQIADALDELKTGISDSGVNLTQKKFLDLRIPIPTLENQVRIIDEVERNLSVVNEVEAQVEANLKRASRLRQGILKRAFEGRLVLRDPNDEPAERLLAHIKDQRQSTLPSTNGKPRSRRPGKLHKSESAMPLFAQDDGVEQEGES